MSRLVFHKGSLHAACENHVDFVRGSFLPLFSTGLSLGFFTGFVVEKRSHQGFFLAFNITTNTTVSYY